VVSLEEPVIDNPATVLLFVLRKVEVLFVRLLVLLLGTWRAGGVLLSAERQMQNRCSGIRMGRKKERRL
jgi:hypothetical protein